MIKKIREYFKNRKEYREAKKALTLMLLNQYSDLLEAEKVVKDAELKAYESMTVFGDTFKPEEFKVAIESLNTVARNPELHTSYYEKVHEDAQKKKNLNVAG